MRPRKTLDDLIEVTVRLPREVMERVFADTHQGANASENSRVMLARAILTGRRRRQMLLPKVQFGEASWDMILDLYLTTHAGAPIDVSSLCIASGAPPTTALRHVAALVEAGYVHREADPRDKRRTYVVMDSSLGRTVDRWLDLQLAALHIDGESDPHLRSVKTQQRA